MTQWDSINRGWTGGRRRVDNSHFSTPAPASADRAVDHRLVDGALLDAPVCRDLLVLAVLNRMLECLLERLSKRRALLHGPAVRRRIGDLACGLELSVALLDRVQR